MKYGELELAFSLPFVDGLESNDQFREWVVSKTPLAEYAKNCVLLDDEMKRKRPKAAYYWRSFYTESCRCDGCSGQETDILSIFESGETRFSLHIEVKQPTDLFAKDKQQAANYPLRAACWAKEDNVYPKTLIPHSKYATALLCSAHKLEEFAPHLEHFDTVITFEEIEAHFPGMYREKLRAA